MDERTGFNKFLRRIPDEKDTQQIQRSGYKLSNNAANSTGVHKTTGNVHVASSTIMSKTTEDKSELLGHAKVASAAKTKTPLTNNTREDDPDVDNLEKIHLKDDTTNNKPTNETEGTAAKSGGSPKPKEEGQVSADFVRNWEEEALSYFRKSSWGGELLVYLLYLFSKLHSANVC